MFSAHANYALVKFINPLWQALSESSLLENLCIDGDRLIVIVDGRPSSLLRFSVLNSLLMTGFKYKCKIYADNSSINEMCDLFADISQFVEIVDLSPLGVQKLSRGVYNELLKSPDFWSLIPASSVLLTQQDALMIEPLSDYFFQYDFIGAPWNPNKFFSVAFPEYVAGTFSEYKEVWISSVMNKGWNPPHSLVGNGGHSIRGVGCMFQISSAEASTADEPEDVFYARNVEHYSSKIASEVEARRFSCESSYSFSFCAHASHLHLEDYRQSEIYERHLKHVAGLYEANSVHS